MEAEVTSNTAIPDCLYRHFKCNMYKVHCIANHSETGEELVVYEALYGDHQIYCRPRHMFEGTVEDQSMPGRIIPRFELVEVLPNA